MFTVVGVALVGRVWLGVPLPRPLVPAAAVMIGGALMILVPDIKVCVLPHSVCCAATHAGLALGCWVLRGGEVATCARGAGGAGSGLLSWGWGRERSWPP